MYTQTREYDKAEKELRTIFEKDSNHLQARILSAKIKDLKGDPVSAKVTLDAIVKENPNEDYAFVELAHVCVELSQYDLAKKNMEIALEIKPNSLNYLSDYADILIEMANYGEAQEKPSLFLFMDKNIDGTYCK